MKRNLKIGIFIIAYQASETLISAYKRIPETFKRRAKEIYCFDDCSNDNTYYSALGYKVANNIKNLSLYKNPRNLGYGGNQKKGYSYGIKKGLDVVVMLHGDAQYAPEKISLLLKPFSSFNSEKVGMVMGSRMMGKPLSGGMPMYKYIGNKLLTKLQNLLLGTNLSEFHSGYRAFNLGALEKIPFKKCSNDFYFDTEIIILLLQAGYKIVEVSIPTYYGPGSKSYVNVFSYGMHCLLTVLKYRLSKIGLIKDSIYGAVESSPYFFKKSKYSSHMQISFLVHKLGAKKILDVGCGRGILGKALGKKWKGLLYGIDKTDFEKHKFDVKAYKKLYVFDLEKEDLPAKIEERSFDLIVFADVLEHLERPWRVLARTREILKANGSVIFSFPNPDFIPVKIIRFLFPKFRMERGPLDKTHKHFFNIKQVVNHLEKQKYKIVKIQWTSPMLSVLSLVSGFKEEGLFYKLIYRMDLFLIKILPRYFSYQFILIAKFEVVSTV